MFAIIISAAWFVAVGLMAWHGVFFMKNPLPLSSLQLAIVLPILAFWVAYFASGRFRRYVLSRDLLLLNTLQCWRVLGAAILIVWGFGLLPGGFAIPMSIFDASVGFFAVAAVLLVVRRPAGWERKVFWINVWGVSDFAVTIILVFIGAPLAIDPEPVASGYADLRALPLSLFPSFAIPFFSILHFMVLLKLRHNETN